MANLGPQPPGMVDAPQSQRPDSLPTPPHTQEHVEHMQAPGRDSEGTISSSPSTTGSVSKCPIRMLDERSPEEIAEYFEHHKHEIPRSHEICVKRFQSNTESIRKLDAKYGNLVNMIQGLGMKHQPLLPAKGDEENFSEVDGKSIKKVENWADNVKEHPEEVDLHSALLANPSDTDAREGHFDRPLKEVRVGESPSRPWGSLSLAPQLFRIYLKVKLLRLPKSRSQGDVEEAQSRWHYPQKIMARGFKMMTSHRWYSQAPYLSDIQLSRQLP